MSPINWDLARKDIQVMQKTFKYREEAMFLNLSDAETDVVIKSWGPGQEET